MFLFRFIGLFLLVTHLYALHITKEQLTVSYVYQLAQNIEWDDSQDVFSIHVISSNAKLHKQFKILADNVKIHNKKIVITISDDENIIKNPHVLFIGKDKHHLHKNIFSKVKNKQTLIISNKYKDKRLVMINLFETDKKTINFEINRANILSKNLKIKPDIILLGGTELDVAYLYQDTMNTLSSKELQLRQSNTQLSKSKKLLTSQKKKLSAMKKEVKLFKKQNNKLKNQIKEKELILKKTKKKILQYNENILKIKNEIKEKNKKISSQEKKLNNISNDFKRVTQELTQTESSLSAQIKKLKKQETIFLTQQKRVLKKEKYLKKLKLDITRKTEEFESLKIKVDEQNKLLKIRDKTIDNQKEFIVIAIIALLVFIIIAMIIGYLLRKQKITNELLENTEEELRIAISRADNNSLNKSKFVASMSHELRTPLNALLGYSKLLQKDKTISQKHQKTFSIIRKSGEHLLALINDILLISKIESGNVELYNKDANIHELIDNMHSMFLLKTQQKGVELKIKITKNVPKYIITDIDKLRQILINLLNNSVKFTNQGSITILADSIDKQLIISIEDTGVGVEKSEIDKLFKQYEQTQSGIDDGTGTGLGLSLVKEFIKLFHGEISVSSELGKGSTFTVTLPYEESDEIVEMEEIKNIIAVAPNQKEFTILVVDDVTVNRELLQELLGIIGFKVSQAANGQEAVEYVKDNRPDLILMDLRMPVMNGTEATKIILDIDKTIPIIALTASIVEMESLLHNPAPFIAATPKPFDENKLLHLMAEYIDITYTYEETIAEVKLEAVSLQNLPEKEKEELLQATKMWNVTVISELIASLSDDYSQEKQFMEKLSSDFDFAKLEEMLNA